MEITPGRYAYRFDGHAMISKRERPWYLVGVGSIEIKNGLVSNGCHRATVHQHNTMDSKFTHGRFSVHGDYHWRASEFSWHANLTFVQDYRRPAGPYQTLIGTFEIVKAGMDDRYWLISSGGIVDRNGQKNESSEVVIGECARIGGIL